MQDSFLEAYEPFINAVAGRLWRKYRQPSYLEAADLAQAGRIGLLDGLTKCNWSFQTSQIHAYLKTRIRGAMMDEIRVMMPGSRRFKSVQLEPLAEEHQDLPSLEDKDGLLFLQGVLNRIRDGRKQAILYRSLVLGHTLQQIGRDIGITESRVSQLRTESLAEIRGGLNA